METIIRVTTKEDAKNLRWRARRLRGFQRGTLWHTDLRRRSSVLYLGEQVIPWRARENETRFLH